jgi:hypothetical protein
MKLVISIYCFNPIFLIKSGKIVGRDAWGEGSEFETTPPKRNLFPNNTREVK